MTSGGGGRHSRKVEEQKSGVGRGCPEVLRHRGEERVLPDVMGNRRGPGHPGLRAMLSSEEHWV